MCALNQMWLFDDSVRCAGCVARMRYKCMRDFRWETLKENTWGYLEHGWDDNIKIDIKFSIPGILIQ
jgi:hypothetical protein